MVIDKNIIDLGTYFAKLRFSDKHHLGLGDIRLTLAQQQDLVKNQKRILLNVDKSRKEGFESAIYYVKKCLDNADITK